MARFTLDWSFTNISGSNTATSGGQSTSYTVATPGNVNGNAWFLGDFGGGVIGLAGQSVTDPMTVDIAFGDTVENISFTLFDIDTNLTAATPWDDQITVIALDADGNQVPVTFTDLAAHHSTSGGTVDASDNVDPGLDTFGAGDSVTVNIAGPIVSLQIIADNGAEATSTAVVGISDIAFTTVELDGYVEGNSGDNVINTGYTDDPDGDRINNNDSVLPGQSNNGDIVIAGGGNDTVASAGSTDEVYGGAGADTINAGSGADIVYGDNPEFDGTLDFNGLSAGDIVLNQFTESGLRVSSFDPAHQVMVFDSDAPTGGDTDLALSGVGNILILSEDGDSADPDDNAGGGTFVFEFTGPTTVNSLDFIDQGTGSEIRLYDEDGVLLSEIDVPAGADNTLITQSIGVSGVFRMEVTLQGEGAVTNLSYTISDAGAAGDTINAGGGADTVYGQGGDDIITGGSGRDTIFGGAGDDTIDGENGRDTIYGGQGNDDISGGGNPDTIFGDEGNDTIAGGTANDIISGGVGADTIFGDDGNDTLSGDSGADSIFGGIGNDTITGGTGADTISGEAGNDNITGDGGDDILSGGDGSDTISGGDDADTISGDLGNDILSGDAGADIIDGGDGDDTIDGGDDDDSLTGGLGIDTITGGAGDDELTGGDGADNLSGGLGSDTFFGGTDGDVVIGGEDADGLDFDVLRLGTADVDTIVYDPLDGEAGTVTFTDGTSLSFSEIELVIPCFTPGTMIATPAGELPVEELKKGDRVLTRDNGIQRVSWVGQRRLDHSVLSEAPDLRPIEIKAGALGHGMPERDMLISPSHRMLIVSDLARVYFDRAEVLVSARHMLDMEGVSVSRRPYITYIHFMCENHEIVLADGAWSESFQPGDYTLKGFDEDQREELFRIFPELQTKEGIRSYNAARRTLKRHEAKLLFTK